jgi:hypothetical protein
MKEPFASAVMISYDNDDHNDYDNYDAKADHHHPKTDFHSSTPVIVREAAARFWFVWPCCGLLV